MNDFLTQKIPYPQFWRIACISGILVNIIFAVSPAKVLAHAGHNHEFKTDTEITTPEGISVDAQTAKRIGIIVKPVKPQFLSIGIKTTGKIETLPNQKVPVTPPIEGKVVELLVKPGAVVKKGETVAVLSSSDLAELRVNSQEKRAEAQANLQQAQADFQLAQQNLERQRQIAKAEINQAQTELRVAQEQYDRDRTLVQDGALPRRQMLESEAHLAEGKSQLTKASSRREVIEAEAQLKRAQASVEVAKSRIQLSSAAYNARLQQLGTLANSQGLVTVIAPISGIVAETPVTLGETVTVDADSKPLMTIVNDNLVYATANIYEKDLKKIKKGQQIRVTVASLPNQTFSGRINLIGAVVEDEKRVIPVKAELVNSSGVLKPGMFAELEVLTDKTANAVIAIPSQAVVDVNSKQVVYVQNGENYQPVEVVLGESSGNLVEVNSGLFAGDLLVTQGAMQLYAQSLRGGNKEKESKSESLETSRGGVSPPLPWWWVLPAGGVLTVGSFWVGRRSSVSNRRDAEDAEREVESVG
ncbi:efflux RND transporter periplasmic adaptor subunit [Anabaena sphaerica FACHB-251]|uniref:Efflux RND transporter periplasmic adaptor subunit n=1 Tax=Anabaena sphaerica FACHB-251 TaxID=2692883 RepID=A0A926WFJ6_9NOST|nr:efflux RND transporter periplasmic adaptor subunit [Anabaena sphaerica]MBD2293640.1 efflux RND transporter periplasmic adaptor subunit [Anabaena sphaerica FACHB-251]